MEFVHCKIPGLRAYVLPIGDIHFGDPAFKREGKVKLQKNLDWLLEHKEEAVGILMGDLFNLGGRNEKTPPFSTDPHELVEAEEFFEPYSGLFVGAIRGNHEKRVLNQYGYDPLQVFCKHLEIPYLGTSALVRVQVGKRPDTDWYWQAYYLYVHHTTGGGKTLGSALNIVTKLEQVISGCDVYAGGHNHQLVTGVKQIYLPTTTGPKSQKVHYVSCGGYLDYPDSYAEEGMLAPTKLGSPRIRLSGERDHHDVHVSI